MYKDVDIEIINDVKLDMAWFGFMLTHSIFKQIFFINIIQKETIIIVV
jgi:hypothetical protein